MNKENSFSDQRNELIERGDSEAVKELEENPFIFIVCVAWKPQNNESEIIDV